MPKYSYDLHMHTCLSPCGMDDMTPPNIANMAYVKGLDIIAITDHNAAGNVRAVMEAAEGLPVTVIPGMEVTTAEEIHVVCLFPSVEAAEAAGDEIYSRLPPIGNKVSFWGHQTLMDAQENVLGEIEYLLPNAADIAYEDMPQFAEKYGGFCFPAHIDRTTTSVLSVFGMVPETPAFKVLEVRRPQDFFADPANEHYKSEYTLLTNSDAHQLVDMAERDRFLELASPDFASLKKALLG